jgi:uncharacterized heparinase superfamily protein
MNMSRALLYARTLRHLRPIQVYGRAWRVFKGLGASQRRGDDADRAPAPPRRSACRLESGAARAAVLIGPTRVRMLGEEGELASPEQWDEPLRPSLWRYHVHYFDDLRSSDAERRHAWNQVLIERWLEEVRPGRGVGWDPYPTSLRIVNWVRYGLGTDKLSDRATRSLAAQIRSLRANLEVHLLGNHLLANAKALLFGGAYFSGHEASEWLAKGLELLARELDEQVLPDGGHFERSAMYHSIVLEDVLDVLALAQAAPNAFEAPAEWRSLANRMRTWLATMCHPDGEIALFNDAAFEQAPSPAALDEYARRLGLGDVATPTGRVVTLESSGFVRVHVGDLFALCDVGEIGPSYLPGHAHADTLTYELSWRGRRWIVDSGASHYQPGPERLRQRSTAAHNTVEVDGESSSEVWGSFRVARRAHPFGLRVNERSDTVAISCSHDGYRRLSGRVVHRRVWRCEPRRLEIEDTLAGQFESAVARAYFHPECSLEAERVVDARGDLATVRVRGAGATVCAATWHPTFGSSCPSRALVATLNTPECTLRLDW